MQNTYIRLASEQPSSLFFVILTLRVLLEIKIPRADFQSCIVQRGELIVATASGGCFSQFLMSTRAMASAMALAKTFFTVDWLKGCNREEGQCLADDVMPRSEVDTTL